MDEDELIVVSCPSCNQRFRVRQQSAGRAVRCPHCSQAVNVPVSVNPPSPTPAPAEENFQLGPPAPQAAVAAVVPEPQRPAAEVSPTSPGQPARPQAAAQPPAEANPFQSPSVEIGPSSIGGLPAKRRYPALQIIRTFYLVLAALVVIGWAIYMVVSLILASRVGGVVAWMWMSMMVTAGVVFVATLLVAIAEVIKLAIDVQSNTLSTARSVAKGS
jgi:predicted Zn finger-like uncharacterized protein